jgi:small subunit ribosomal protein S6e
MSFKINVSHKGKTLKYDSDNEELVGKKIKEVIDGKEISQDLEGYELEITGTSDKAGFPGFEEYSGTQLKKVLLKKGKGMQDNRKGVRLRKLVRGNIISLDIIQINTKVLKEGSKKFEELAPKTEESK